MTIKERLERIEKHLGIEQVIPTIHSGAVYKKIGLTHIVEIDPLDLKITEQRDRQGRYFTEKNFMTASFIGHHSDGRTYPTSILVSEGKIISNCQPNGLYSGVNEGKGNPAPTLIIFKSGKVEMHITNDITKFENVQFAVSGWGVKPYTSAGFKGFERSVGYSTHRNSIGYRSSDNKIVLFYRPFCSARRAEKSAKGLKLDFALSTDSGGSANFVVNSQKIHTTSRRIYAGVTW